jgi:hypothetical protein
MEARPYNGNKTDGSKSERRVAVLSMMETSTLTGDIDHMEASKTVQRQQDRRVREGAEGGRLANDGDIHITSMTPRLLTSWNTVRATPCLRATGGECKVELTLTSTTWSNTARATPCLKAAVGECKEEYFMTSHEVEYYPPDTLFEGRR